MSMDDQYQAFENCKPNQVATATIFTEYSAGHYIHISGPFTNEMNDKMESKDSQIQLVAYSSIRDQ